MSVTIGKHVKVLFIVVFYVGKIYGQELKYILIPMYKIVYQND